MNEIEMWSIERFRAALRHQDNQSLSNKDKWSLKGRLSAHLWSKKVFRAVEEVLFARVNRPDADKAAS
jgi:hypothetical protein